MAERGLGVANELNEAGAQAAFVAGDVLDADSIRAAIDQAASEIGGVDICVASAGVSSHPDAGFRGFLDLDPDHFDFVNNVNVRGVFLTAQRAAQLMIEAGHGGSIVSLASIASKRPSAGVYSVSKAAVWMLTRSLAEELAPHKIRVNAIGPAYVTTEMLAGIVAALLATTPSRNRRGTTSGLPRCRWGCCRRRSTSPTRLCSCAATRQRCSPDRSCIPTVE